MLTFAYHFPVGELWASSELLGKVFEIDRDGYVCRLIFPAGEDDFGMTKSPESPLTGSSSGTHDNPRQQVGVALVRVEVEVISDIDASDIPPGGPVDEQKLRELRVLLDEAVEPARSIVSDILKWARVELDQYWLAPQFSPPKTAWMTDIHDSAGRRLGTGYDDPSHVSITSKHPATPGDVEAILSAASSGREPALAGQLLADAQFHARGPGTVNPNLGVLLAAISAELGIKRFLTDHATEDQKDLVDLMVVNRLISLAAAQLYDSGLKAVVARSLKEDDKDAYHALDALFTARNRIAHRGEYAVTPKESAEHLKAALRAADYLSSIS